MSESRLITDRAETLARLDLALALSRQARDLVLPVRVPLADACASLTAACDALRRARHQCHPITKERTQP